MVTVTFDDNLNAVTCCQREQSSHGVLPPWMKLSLWVFNDDKCAGFCRQACGYDGQHMSEAKSNIRRSQRIAVRCLLAPIRVRQSHEVGHRHCLWFHAHARTELLHPGVNLREQTRRA